MQQISEELHRKGKIVGLVPTMGFLHKGHLSLVANSKKTSDVTVVSVFVNPTQFGPSEDFAKYPRNTKRDLKLLREVGADYVFIPDAEDIYPPGFETYLSVEKAAGILEGKSRPSHFRGVTTIVAMLFNIVSPDAAFFGQKDAQQAFIIRQMVRDLKYRIRIKIIPIVREKDGLALSSRNIYLSEQERKDALVLHQSLEFASRLISDGEKDAAGILSEMRRIVGSVNTSNLDYVTIVDETTFKPVSGLVHGRRYYVLAACRIGKTRLIDNILIRA